MARMAGASVTKTAELACVSIGTVTKVTSAFRSMGKTSLNGIGHYAGQHTFDECDICALVQYAKKKRRATLPQVTGSKNSPSTII